MMYVVERNKKVRLVGRRKRYCHRIPVRRSVAKSAANIGRAGVPMASETCLVTLVDHWSGRADVPHVRLEGDQRFLLTLCVPLQFCARSQAYSQSEMSRRYKKRFLDGR
jgi:hypothetical protein